MALINLFIFTFTAVLEGIQTKDLYERYGLELTDWIVKFDCRTVEKEMTDWSAWSHKKRTWSNSKICNINTCIVECH